MAYAVYTSDHNLHAEPGLFARIRTAFANYRRFRETLGELEQMTDRELLDLNLARHGLRDVARQAVYGR